MTLHQLDFVLLYHHTWQETSAQAEEASAQTEAPNEAEALRSVEARCCNLFETMFQVVGILRHGIPLCRPFYFFNLLHHHFPIQPAEHA